MKDNEISYCLSLYGKFCSDTDYIEYCNKYNKDGSIDIELVKKLLNKHKDLYHIFLKIQVVLYYRDIRDTDEEFYDCYHINGNKILLSDIDILVRNHYYVYFDRCKKCIESIITSKLVPKNELDILRLVKDRDINTELVNFD